MATIARSEMKFFDIAANMTDPMFQGIYRDKQYHKPDLSAVIQRAEKSNVQRMLVMGSNLEDSERALNIAKLHPQLLHSTVGVHPCHATDIDKATGMQQYMDKLADLAAKGMSSENESHVRAFGELGLDYDRLHYASKDTQISCLQAQLDILLNSPHHLYRLPLFLHSRAAHSDFAQIVFPAVCRMRELRKQSLPSSSQIPTISWKPDPDAVAVVHSFTGTEQELQDLLSHGLYVGVNGCSLKTSENLQVVKNIPLDRLLLETDAPWCEMRASHASVKLLLQAQGITEEQGTQSKKGKSKNPTTEAATKLIYSPFEFKKPEKFIEGDMVRGRCEPCQINNVAKVVSQLHNVPVETVISHAWTNSLRLFGQDLDV